MVNIRDLILAALVGAVVSETVKLFFEYIKSKLKPGLPPPPPRDKRVRAMIIWLGIGAVLGALIWLILYPLFITAFWTFDNGPDNWVFTYNTLDASAGVDWDDDKKVLIAQFDFSQVAGSIGTIGRDPRATYTFDNLLPDWRHDWTGYETLKVDIKNTTGYPLEVSFSIFVDSCYYEFGGWNNLPSKATYTTVVFDFTEPRYKTCMSSDTFTNNPGPLDRVERLDLIVGENVAPNQLANVKGAVFIDNIRLQRNMRPLWIILFILGVFFVVGLILNWMINQEFELDEGQKQEADAEGKEKKKSEEKAELISEFRGKEEQKSSSKEGQ